jgi:hypothetical protein
VSTVDRRLLAREAALSTALAASLAALLLWATPPGVDWAAHAYQRAFLLQHGFALWNNFWYAGRYSFVTYSLLYYPMAALLGIRVLALASIATAAGAFTIVVLREWGREAKLSSRTFAVLWVGIISSAAFPFALATSFALLSIFALQEGRRGRFALGAVLTLAASPLAFVLLAIVGGGALLARRSVRNVGLPIFIIAGAGAAELVLYRLFGDGGRYPFPFLELVPALMFAGLGLAVTRGVATARALYGAFWVYLAVLLVAYVVPSGVGSNIDRVRYLALPLALLAVTLRHWRPLWLVLPVLVLATVWNLTPIVTSFASSASSAESVQTYWQPSIAYLHHRLTPSYRVEAVDTVDHWPAAYLPEAGIPLVRGWYRQSDYPENTLLYSDDLSRTTYDAWLRSLGVRYVVLSDATPDYSSRAEATLIRMGRSGLVPVFRSAHTIVYEVPHARSIITGHARAIVVSMGSSQMQIDVTKAGTYRVAVRWSPYWQAAGACTLKGKDGMLRVRAAAPGLINLTFSVSVQRSLETLAGSVPNDSCTP